MKEYLKSHDLTISMSTKKHLKPNLEKTFKDNLKFILVQKRVYLYPKTLTLEQTVIDLIVVKSGMDGEMLTKAGMQIRSEVTEMKDEMPWPPHPEDLQPDKFKMPYKLGLFLTAIFTGGKMIQS